MGAVIGLSFAVGFLMLVQGLISRPRRRQARRIDMRQTLRHAGISIAAGIAGGGTALVLTGVPMAGLLAGGSSAALPVMVRRRDRERRRKSQRAAWPDAVDDLLTAVRAGVPLSEAICEAAVSGPEPLRAGFAAHATAWRRGASFTDSLAAMQRYFADPAADRVVISLAMAAESGGRNVGRMLATQGDFLRADLRMRGEIDARQSWTVNGARVAVAAPWLAVLLLCIRGDSAAAYATATGGLVLFVTAVVGVIAYATMSRIAALPQPKRLAEVGG